MRSPSEEWHSVAWQDHTDHYAFVEGLHEATVYSLRLRLINAFGTGSWSEEISFTTRRAGPSFTPCEANDETLCFFDGRFSVTVAWRDQRSGDTGVGHALPASAGGADRSGYFWFFKPDNVELVVKVLDGTPINGEHWFFYGGLSDVEYWITLEDRERGEQATFHNPPGEICGDGFTRPFDPGAASLASSGSATTTRGFFSLPAAKAGIPVPRSRTTSPSHPFEPCVEDAETLCLLDGRFRVRVTWEDQHNGGSGVGGAVAFADRSGFFWFFNPANVELVVKVLDGTPVNGKIWVFYGALSDVGYTIDVLDTFDGHLSRQYVNPPGNLCGDADTQAF